MKLTQTDSLTVHKQQAGGVWRRVIMESGELGLRMALGAQCVPSDTASSTSGHVNEFGWSALHPTFIREAVATLGVSGTFAFSSSTDT